MSQSENSFQYDLTRKNGCPQQQDEGKDIEGKSKNSFEEKGTKQQGDDKEKLGHSENRIGPRWAKCHQQQQKKEDKERVRQSKSRYGPRRTKFQQPQRQQLQQQQKKEDIENVSHEKEGKEIASHSKNSFGPRGTKCQQQKQEVMNDKENVSQSENSIVPRGAKCQQQQQQQQKKQVKEKVSQSANSFGPRGIKCHHDQQQQKQHQEKDNKEVIQAKNSCRLRGKILLQQQNEVDEERKSHFINRISPSDEKCEQAQIKEDSREHGVNIKSLEDSSENISKATVVMGNKDCKSSNKESKRYAIIVPSDLRHVCRDISAHSIFQKICGASDVKYDEAKDQLVILSDDDDVLRKASLLEDVHMRGLRTIHELKRDLKRDAVKLQHRRNIEQTLCAEEFEVPEHLMGLAIGPKGANIKKAENVDGVTSIHRTDCVFKVRGQSAESVSKARAILEYTHETVCIPIDLVDRIIGRAGSNIKHIIDKSGVIRVTELDEINDSMDEQCVPFVIVGTTESINSAKLMLQFNLSQLKQQQTKTGKVQSDSLKQSAADAATSNDRSNQYFSGKKGAEPPTSQKNLSENTLDEKMKMLLQMSEEEYRCNNVPVKAEYINNEADFEEDEELSDDQAFKNEFSYHVNESVGMRLVQHKPVQSLANHNYKFDSEDDKYAYIDDIEEDDEDDEMEDDESEHGITVPENLHIFWGKGKQKNWKVENKADERNTKTVSSSKEEDVNENEVFKFLVKDCGGLVKFKEFIEKCHLFPPGIDAGKWLLRHKHRFSLYVQNQEILYVIPMYHGVKLCLDYNRNQGCKKKRCKYLHICRNYVAGHCKFRNCKYLHNLSDQRNRELLKAQGLDGVFTDEEVKILIRYRYPLLCPDYSSSGQCSEEETCPFLHFCRKFLINKCFKIDGCECGHDLLSDHNRWVLSVGKWESKPEDFIKRLILVDWSKDLKSCEEDHKYQTETINRTSNRSNLSSSELEVKESNIFLDHTGAIPKTTSKTSTSVITKHPQYMTEDAIFYPVDKETMMQEKTWMTDDANNKPICADYIQGKCKNCENGHHPPTLVPYLWQIKIENWESVDACTNEGIENEFCLLQDPLLTEFTYTVWQKGISYTVNIRSDYMGIPYGWVSKYPSKDVKVRRLSTESYAEVQGDIGFYTQWRWYWKDDADDWILYEKDSFQKTLESKYLFGQNSYLFMRQDVSYNYKIDFKTFLQENLETNTQRQIMRRPLFVSDECVELNIFPRSLSVPELPDPPTHFTPWDLTNDFELVELDVESQQFKEVKRSFRNTMESRKSSVKHIYQIQNRELLNEYNTKKKNMLEEISREGNMRDVGEKQLFHGTDSLNTCRAICTNNFDFRTSGKNATVFGQGSYFAVDASYSHRYTNEDSKGLRYMFLVKVLTGIYTEGKSSYRRPPSRPGSTHKLFDSCVDNMSSPRMHVIFDRAQSYPEYLIIYKDRIQCNDGTQSHSSSVSFRQGILSSSNTKGYKTRAHSPVSIPVHPQSSSRSFLQGMPSSLDTTGYKNGTQPTSIPVQPRSSSLSSHQGMPSSLDTIGYKNRTQPASAPVQPRSSSIYPRQGMPSSSDATGYKNRTQPASVPVQPHSPSISSQQRIQRSTETLNSSPKKSTCTIQ